ncbi:unnamed protein product [Caenorhabditis sp. 36 PRJEB53466]|nr:unnamed protein product [Caenorhabditis sp. 36 PRJEB53466]
MICRLETITTQQARTVYDLAGGMRDMQPPSMGINGFGRRSHNFSSPSLVDYRSNHAHFGSQPSIVQNGGSQSPPDYALLFDPPVVVLRSKKPSTVRSAKEESRLRSQQPPSNIQRVQAIRSRPQSTASYNSLASSGMENIQWRNSVMSSVTPDNRRHTLYDDEDTPRVVSNRRATERLFIFCLTGDQT